MILRLDPTLPVVWRSPSTVQFGAERAVCVIDGVTAATERMLAALAVGAPEGALVVIAETTGADAAAAAALIAAVQPALLANRPAAPASWRAPESLRIAIDGTGPASRHLAAVLHCLGVGLVSSVPPDGDEDAGDGEAEVDAAVLVGSYAIAPTRHGAWLRRDVPHLGVVFGEGGARIGPFVEPGVGPCLACLDLARTDHDPSWPLLATQLTSRRAPAEAGGFEASVTLRVAGALLDHLSGDSRELAAASLELGLDGGERLTPQAPHARCGCRALPGTATADVLSLGFRRSAPSSAAAAAAHG